MRIAALGGAGLMGQGIVKDLVSEMSKNIEKVIVADVSAQKARQLVNELKNDRLESQQLDVLDKEKLQALLEKVDVCVNTVPTGLGYQMEIFLQSLEAECPYMDLGGMGVWTKRQKEQHEKFFAKGVPAILGMGSAPGITNILAKYCAEQLDKIEKISIYWVGRQFGPESPIFTPPYNVLTLIGEYCELNSQFLDGEMKIVPALSGKQVLVLPEPFGRTEFWYTLHSETTTVPYAKGIKEKGIKECTWRLSIPARVDGVMRALGSCGFGDKEPLKVNGVDVSPQKFLAALIDRNIEKNKEKIPVVSFEEAKDHELYFAIGEGEKEDKKIKVTAELLQLPDRLYEGYVDAATSMAASVAAQMLGRGEIPAGVWAPEECIDVTNFFKEMKKRKFKVTTRIEKEI